MSAALAATPLGCRVGHSQCTCAGAQQWNTLAEKVPMELQEALRRLEVPAKSRHSASKYDFVKVRQPLSLLINRTRQSLSAPSLFAPASQGCCGNMHSNNRLHVTLVTLFAGQGVAWGEPRPLLRAVTLSYQPHADRNQGANEQGEEWPGRKDAPRQVHASPDSN